MIRSKKRMTLCITLLVINLVFIWGNSLLASDISAAFSKLVGRFLSLFITGPFAPDEGEGHGLLRKVAHFTEFCTLGMLISWQVRMLKVEKWSFYALPILSGLVIAFVDETIQFFVPGRGPRFSDVAIDTAGVLLGTLILSLMACLSARKRDNNKIS